jgi:hypothetical protein
MTINAVVLLCVFVCTETVDIASAAVQCLPPPPPPPLSSVASHVDRRGACLVPAALSF